MKQTLIVLSLMASPVALAGHPGGMGAPMNAGPAAMSGHSSAGMMGPTAPMSPGMGHADMHAADNGGAVHAGTDIAAGSHGPQAQEPLRDAQVNGGAFRMLEQKTGLSADELKTMYSTSGAKNFGEFTSAVVVSRNLGLDTHAVLDGLKTSSLGATLKSLGVPSDKARHEIRRAQREARSAG